MKAESGAGPIPYLMRDLRRCRIGLTREEEAELITKAQAGDQAARDRIVEGVLPFCLMKAKKHYLPRQRDRYELEDCFQWAVMGVLRAIETFEPERGLRFLTYAAHFVVQQMQYHGRQARTMVRVPAHVYDSARNGDKESRRIVEWAGTSARVDHCSTGDDPAVILGTVADHVSDLVEAEEGDAQLAWLDKQLAALKDQEREVIRGRLKGKKLFEVGESLGVSRERARQVETVALRKLAKAAGRPRAVLSMHRGQVGEAAEEFSMEPKPRKANRRGHQTRELVLGICRERTGADKHFELSYRQLAASANMSRTNAMAVMQTLVRRNELVLVKPGKYGRSAVYRFPS